MLPEASSVPSRCFTPSGYSTPFGCFRGASTKVKPRSSHTSGQITFQKANPKTQWFSGHLTRKRVSPSSIRTVPSTPEFHRVLRASRSWVITTDRELGALLPHPAPKDIYDCGLSIWRVGRDVKKGQKNRKLESRKTSIRQSGNQLSGKSQLVTRQLGVRKSPPRRRMLAHGGLFLVTLLK